METYERNFLKMYLRSGRMMQPPPINAGHPWKILAMSLNEQFYCERKVPNYRYRTQTALLQNLSHYSTRRKKIIQMTVQHVLRNTLKQNIAC